MWIHGGLSVYSLLAAFFILPFSALQGSPSALSLARFFMLYSHFNMDRDAKPTLLYLVVVTNSRTKIPILPLRPPKRLSQKKC